MNIIKKILTKVSSQYMIKELKKRGLKVGDNVDVYSSYIDRSHCCDCQVHLSNFHQITLST